MSIKFHCEHCGKKIEASDTAGGKWGKCPACHNKIYIPDLNAEADFKLAPIDEEEERRKKQLIAETYRIRQDILLEKETPEDSANSGNSSFKADIRELEKNIIIYLRNMADGELEQAKQVENFIIANGKKAIDVIDKIALSEIPEPELADIPQQVLSGLIRNLRAKIS